MNTKMPSLRRHQSGQWITKWGGQTHYLGHDDAAAQAAYIKSLTEWSKWRESRDQKRATKKTAWSVAEIAKEFMKNKEAEGGPDRRRYYSNHLRRFVAVYGNVRADAIRAGDLNEVKLDMMRAKVRDSGGRLVRQFGNSNIRHDLTAVKSMFRWAAGMELIPPLSLDFVKVPERDETPDKSYSPDEAWGFIRSVPEDLGHWLALQYLTLMRPSEVVRVVAGQGEWVEPWLFRPHVYKMKWRTREPRMIVFSDAALSYLRHCRPIWSRYDTYYQATRRAVAGTDYEGYAPHPLRHSGSTHLGQLGVSREDIDLLLGHLPSYVSRTYNRTFWQRLRAPADRIAASPVVRPGR